MSLLRPPSHRGPLIAAGATVLTAGVVLQQLRVDDIAAGWQALICGGLAAVCLWLAVGAPLEGGRPPAYQSVLIVCGLVNLVPALVHLADVLGAELDGLKAGLGTWVSAVLAAVAGLLAARRNSGIAAFISAVAGVVGLIFLSDWLWDPAIGTIRVLLLLSAVTLVVLSLILRGPRPRHSEQLVNAAGLAILSIPVVALGSVLFGFPDTPELPGFWEVVVVGAGFGLVAYAAADRTPGPAYLGVANLAAFAAVTSLFADPTLEWWPFVLLVVGGLMLAAGLRPARPLPPEPDGFTKDDLPLHSRVEGDERVFTVRD
jgi:hypothetical protein